MRPEYPNDASDLLAMTVSVRYIVYDNILESTKSPTSLKRYIFVAEERFPLGTIRILPFRKSVRVVTRLLNALMAIECRPSQLSFLRSVGRPPQFSERGDIVLRVLYAPAVRSAVCRDRCPPC